MKYESDNLNELYNALCKTQMDMESASKDASNPFFKSKYASFESVVACSRPYLTKNGLCIIQRILTEEDRSFLLTRMGHSSGQWMESKVELKPPKSDPQSLASYITYMRRYTYSAFCCIVTEDDDGEKSMHGIRAEPVTPAYINESQISALKDKLGPDRLDGFLSYYGISDLSVFPKNKFVDAVTKLDKKKND